MPCCPRTTTLHFQRVTVALSCLGRHEMTDTASSQTDCRLRLLLIESVEIWRRFVLAVVGEDPATEVVGIAEDRLDGLRKARELRPDIVLIDIGPPQIRGIEVVRQIRNSCPESRILFLLENSDPDTVVAAFSVGAHGYVLKSKTDCDLPLALRVVRRQKRFIGRGVRKFK